VGKRDVIFLDASRQIVRSFKEAKKYYLTKSRLKAGT
jgi:hypothetical protein